MSERTPQPAGPAEQNKQKLEAKLNSSESEWKMLGIAKQAAEAKKNGNQEDYAVAAAAIKAQLETLVTEGQVTPEGARNRAKQIDKIIDNLVNDNGLTSGPAEKVAVSTRTGRTEATPKAEPTPVVKLEDEPAAPAETTPEAPAADDKAERTEGTGTEEDPVHNKAPEDLPTPEELEENSSQLGWRARARRSLGLKANYAKNLFKAGGNFTVARNMHMAETGISDEEMAERRKKNGKVMAGLAIAGAAVWGGMKIYAATKGFESMNGGGNPTDHAQGGGGSHEGGDYTEVPAGSEFDYNHDLDPFYQDGKLGVHNYGAPLEADTMDVNGVDGAYNLTENWKHNSGQLSVAAAEMGLPGFSADDTDPSQFGLESADDMAEALKADPAQHEQAYDQLIEILNKDNTKVEEIQLEPGTYGSYYQVDVNGDLVNAYDPSVNEAGTGIKYTYQLDDGTWHSVIFKKECGGQVVHLNEVTPEVAPSGAPVEIAPAPVYGGGTPEQAVYGGGTPYQPGVPSIPHTPETPDAPTVPDTPDTPEVPDAPTVPDTPDTPEVLAPKEFDGSEPHIKGAPPAEVDTNEYNSLGDPIQNNTDPEVIEQAPAAPIPNQEQTGGTADGAEQTTETEQQEVEATPPATGATTEETPGEEVTSGFFN